MRHPLARALRGAGLDSVEVAGRLGVDPKTVQRWLAGRVPYPRYRSALVDLTGWASHDLWPDAVRIETDELGTDKVRVAYPHRSAIPSDVWPRLFQRAEREIAILVYSGLFLAENAVVLPLLRDKARAGVRVRIALGDPDGRHVARRGADEAIDAVMVARIRNALLLYRPLMDGCGAEMRLHDTILYNSIYRADQELLINMHVYGCPASHAPCLHLRSAQPNGIAGTYFDSFERVWALARPVDAIRTGSGRSV